MEIAFVLLLTILSIILFVSDLLRADMVALLVMVTVLVTGLCTPEEALAGFSNRATVTVAAMFVLSAGLESTGALNPLSRFLGRMIRTRGPLLALTVTSLLTGLISAFINNTAAVAILLPVVMSATRRAKVGPGKYLMAISFVSMAGGTMTLFGTSTNLLVNSEAVAAGEPAFSLFEFLPLGIVLLLISVAYMSLVGKRLLPDRRPPADLTSDFEVGPYLRTLKISPGGVSDKLALQDSALNRLEGDILGLKRRHRPRSAAADFQLESDDEITVRVDDPGALESQNDKLGVTVEDKPVQDSDLENDSSLLVEAGVASNIEGSTLKSSDVKRSFQAVPLAVNRKGKVRHRNLEELRLRNGDTILFKVQKDNLNQLRLSKNFIILSEEDQVQNEKRWRLAIAIMFGVVLAASTSLLPIVAAASVGSVAMILTGCLSIEKAYKAIDWKVIMLLAGMLSLGQAMTQTGTAAFAARELMSLLRDTGPYVALAVIYAVTTLMTAAMSNNATAVILSPVAISVAESLTVSPRPFLVAVAFAASACFASPVGYQTNVMIYGPGRFRFRDFLLVGGPLNLIFLAVSVYLIPKIWGF
ncbi:MAG TPA: SLC13 family permease [Phycisphaerales bacterium]|nr:SLC13 family permease [Phycisphaerales bacterium]